MTNIEQLKEHVTQLKALLDDPQPGLATKEKGDYWCWRPKHRRPFIISVIEMHPGELSVIFGGEPGSLSFFHDCQWMRLKEPALPEGGHGG